MSLRERLRQRHGGSQPELRTTLDLLRALDHHDPDERARVQQALEDHEGSLLTWKGSDDRVYSGSWFMGVLHRNCIRQWQKGPRGKYQAPEALVTDVRDLYLGFLHNPTGRLRTADAEKPWLPLCTILTKTARRQLWATEPETVSHVGKNAVADLTLRMRTLLSVRAQIKTRGTGPGWLADVFGDRYSTEDVLHVLNALLEPGVAGQPLTLDSRLDDLARGLIRLSPRVVGDGQDGDDVELEEDHDDDSEK